MRSPELWERRGAAAALLQPPAWLYDAVGRLRRRLVRPWRAGVPVICVGALTVGGAGKTPAVIAIAARLREQGHRPHILTRGYKGRQRGPLQVAPAVQDAGEVGDEALLLAAAAPTWVARDRIAGARAAIAAGAGVLLLDDGFQNPGLAKDLSLVVIDGGQGIGNGRLLPAGPLRESLSGGLGRAQAAILVGADATGVSARVPRRLPLLRARLAPHPDDAGALAGRQVLAFAGIGRPQKFFASLAEIGARVVGERIFADHHAYTEAEIDALLTEAASLGAVPVTTEKDAVRLAPRRRGAIRVLRVSLALDRPAELDRLLAAVVPPPGA